MFDFFSFDIAVSTSRPERREPCEKADWEIAAGRGSRDAAAHPLESVERARPDGLLSPDVSDLVSPASLHACPHLHGLRMKSLLGRMRIADGPGRLK